MFLGHIVVGKALSFVQGKEMANLGQSTQDERPDERPRLDCRMSDALAGRVDSLWGLAASASAWESVWGLALLLVHFLRNNEN